MKRVYVKPELELDSFMLDASVAASGSCSDQFIEELKSYWDEIMEDEWDNYGGYEAGFEKFVEQIMAGHTSGNDLTCYYTLAGAILAS